MGMKITLTDIEAAELPTLLECLEQCGLRSRATIEEQSTMASLSGREVTILRLMAEGADDRRIASRLCVGKDRARQLIIEIYYKLGASNRAHAVALAMRHHPHRTACWAVHEGCS
jgi:DNA-binding CsgD family transcriptional regulator